MRSALLLHVIDGLAPTLAVVVHALIVRRRHTKSQALRLAQHNLVRGDLELLIARNGMPKPLP